MNDNKELLKKLRESLEGSVKRFLKLSASDMTQLTTTDGDTISIDSTDLTVGASVYIIDENGNLTPAEDGDYTFEDGRIITVTDGKISTISGSPVSPDETVSPETGMKQEMATNEATTETSNTDVPVDDDSDLEKRIGDLEAQVQEILSLLQASTSANEQLMSRVEKLSKEPATDSIKTNKTFSSVNDVKTIADYKKMFRD